MPWSTGMPGMSRWLARVSSSQGLGCAWGPNAGRASSLSGSSYAHLAANVYISEGRDTGVISQLSDAVQTLSPGVRLGHVFVDDAYNRTGLTLVSSSVDRLVRGAMAVSTLALDLIDLRRHEATHPRLGVVDHVSCHPLVRDDATMLAARMARDAIGKALGERGVPTYLYGFGVEADLASVRRRFGYFRANTSGGEWRGSGAEWVKVLQETPPDYGPRLLRDEWGIACVGCLPWVVNHNVVLNTSDLGLAKELAKRVSERGGGLANVQAMGLAYEDGKVEVACNLLDAAVSGPEDVNEYLSRVLDDARGNVPAGSCVRIVRSYQTGKSVEELCSLIS